MNFLKKLFNKKLKSVDKKNNAEEQFNDNTFKRDSQLNLELFKEKEDDLNIFEKKKELKKLNSEKLEKLELDSIKKIKNLKKEYKKECKTKIDKIPKPPKMPFKRGIKEVNGVLVEVSEKEFDNLMKPYLHLSGLKEPYGEKELKDALVKKYKEASSNKTKIKNKMTQEDVQKMLDMINDPTLDKYYNQKYGEPIQKYNDQIIRLTIEEPKEISNLIERVACIKWILRERKEKKIIKKIKFNILGTTIELEKD